MKKRIVILMIMFLIPMSFSVQSLYAQTKTKEEEQAELKFIKEIESQKKAMIEMQRVIEDQKKALEVPLPVIDSIASKVVRTFDYYDIRNTRPVGTGPFNAPQSVDHFASGRTSWDFSKSVTEATFSKEYAIDVDKGSKNVSLSISGTCRTGEIRIAVLMPGGKPYSEAVIDEFGNLNWRKSLQIAEDNTDKIGEWKFKISAKGATGNFNISLQVN
jgi:hypothetical protein